MNSAVFKIILPALLIIFSARGLFAQNLKIILTSNIEASFSTKTENQEHDDPMLLLAQSIIYERARGADLYFDLGNSFFPGILSKYSYGAAVMDFFDFFGCNASLISSHDLRIGVDSLEYLQQTGKTALLSSNILRDDESVFKPYTVYRKGNKSVGVIGVTSKKVLFDIAEKNVYNIKRESEAAAVKKSVSELKSQNVDRIILLSGLNTKENIKLMMKNSDIDLILSGGDNKGEDLHIEIRRIDSSDGRSLIIIPPSYGYTVVDIDISSGAVLKNISANKTVYRKTSNREYADFLGRLTLWKKNYIEDANSTAYKSTGKKLVIDGEKIANLIRDRYKSELAVIHPSRTGRFESDGDFRLYDIRSEIFDSYSLFFYSVTGEELLKLRDGLDEKSVVGLSDSKVQNYQVDPVRRYSVVSTQSVYEAGMRVLGIEVPYRNLWKNYTDIIKEDLDSKKVLYKSDFNYLDDRFRVLIDLFISFAFDSSSIQKSGNMQTPAGQPYESYMNIGSEDRLDVIFYNRFHRIQLSPYINIMRQLVEPGVETYTQNLFRGTLLYNLNLSTVINPYLKSQIEAQVFKVEGLAPATIRETLGGLLGVKYFTAKLGLGFEKQVVDPERPLIFGIEAAMNFKIDFLKYFTYSLNLDMFVSIGFTSVPVDMGYVRSELENALTVSITPILSVSIKHKWYNNFMIGTEQNYSNSQFLASINMNSNFKFF